MESFNLGAVLVVLLLLVWLGVAIPRIAERREVMGRSRDAEATADSAQARDLTEGVRTRRRSPEVQAPMPAHRLLTRGRTSDAPSSPDVAAWTVEPPAAPGRRDARPAMRIALIVLGVLSLLGLGLAAAAVLPWYVGLVPVVLLTAYVIGLRRAELARRARRAEHSSTSAERPARAFEPRSAEKPAVQAPSVAPIKAAEGDAEKSAPVAAPAPVRTARPAPRAGEWTPLPVPRPSYSLRGDVDDLGSRHRAHNTMLGLGQALESEDVEAHEAVAEQVENLRPAVDLHLDDILERRRGA